MKISKIVLSLFLASALLGATARAADPQPAAPSAADLQALMAILNKLVAQSAAANEAAPDVEPEPAPAAKAPAAPEKQPLSTALKTGGLSIGSLGGRGPGTALARMTEEAWRLLFPAKQPGH